MEKDLLLAGQRELDPIANPPSELTMKGWKDQGKQYYQSKHYEQASHCYKSALTHCDPDVCAVLQNCSIAHLRLGDHLSAVQYAMAAVHVSNGSKAMYRAAQALEALDSPQLAIAFLAKSQVPDTALEGRLRDSIAAKGSTSLEVDDVCNEDVYRSIAEILSSHEQAPENPGEDVLSRPPGTLQSLKEKGNESFKKHDFETALKYYTNALKCENAKEVGILLLNQSACQLALKNYASAFLLSDASIIIHRSCAKSHYRRATALDKLGLQDAALNMLKSAPEDPCISSLQNTISARKSKQQRPKVREGPTEMDVHRAHNRDAVSTDMLSSFNQMVRMFSSAGAGDRKLELFDDRVVAFHEEFARDGNWPKGCDKKLCREKLLEAYENSVNQPMTTMMLEKSETFDSMKISYWGKRCNGSRDLMVWLDRARIGDIRFPDHVDPYTSQTVHSFSNQTREASIHMKSNSTHVSIGFVDLGELLFNTIGSNVRWVGYEASEYSVAKTLVLAEMMRSRVESAHVAEVWFSSTWSRKTFCFFKTALQSVLMNKTLPRVVQDILAFWQGQVYPISLSEARKRWLAVQTKIAYMISNMITKPDRDALCSYVLTGDICSSPEVGSVVMWMNPPGIGHLALSESVLEFLPPKMIWSRRKHVDNIITAAIDTLTDRIDALSKSLSSGSVTIDVRFGELFPDSDIARHIGRELRPATMSWSNLNDYYAAVNFHTLAFQCSHAGTTHFIFPMNWLRNVRGCFLLDYDDASERKKFFKDSSRALKQSYASHGLSEYLFAPSIGHSMNYADWFLCSRFFRSWFSGFLKQSPYKIRDGATIEQPLFTAEIHHGCSTIAGSYQYDKS